MAGRKPSPDPAKQRAIYPPNSLWERAEAQAAKRGEKPAAYVTEALRQRVEKDEASQ